jgi:hypothetical protein
VGLRDSLSLNVNFPIDGKLEREVIAFHFGSKFVDGQMGKEY